MDAIEQLRKEYREKKENDDRVIQKLTQELDLITKQKEEIERMLFTLTSTMTYDLPIDRRCPCYEKLASLQLPYFSVSKKHNNIFICECIICGHCMIENKHMIEK